MSLRVTVCNQLSSLFLDLYQFYLDDLSKFRHVERDTLGRFSHHDLGRYFNSRFGIALMFVRKLDIIGFALIGIRGDGFYSMDDFFISPAYRRRNYGKIAARRIFMIYCGEWTTSQIAQNEVAIEFWRAVLEDPLIVRISEHTEWSKFLKSDIRVTRLHS